METIYLKRAREVKQKKEEIEKKLQISIEFKGNSLTMNGEPVNEYVAHLVFEAIDFGFTVKQSLVLADEEMTFQKVRIKDHTKRNLKDVRARLIGTKGKTKRVIEDVSKCKIIIQESEVGIIGDVESVENASNAIINLIKGSKQSNMYAYLERMNRSKKDNSLPPDFLKE